MKYSPDGTRQQSPEGLHKVVTLVNNQTASKNTTTIQEALDDRGIIWLSGKGVFEINKTLIIPSNTTIHIGAGIELKCAGNTPFLVFANENSASSPKAVTSLTVAAIGHFMLRATINYTATPDVKVGDYVLIKGDTSELYNKVHQVESVSNNAVTFLIAQSNGNTASATGTLTATKADANVKIYGPGRLNGNFVGGTFTATATYQDHAILLNNIDKPVVSGVEFLDFRKYCICIANAVSPDISYIAGNTGSDGVHIYGPCWSPRVKNVSGVFGDDAVVLQTIDGSLYSAYQPPNSGGSFYEGGQIENINTGTTGNSGGVVIYPAGGDGSGDLGYSMYGTFEVDNVGHAASMKGSINPGSAFALGNGYVTDVGRIDQLALRNVRGVIVLANAGANKTITLGTLLIDGHTTHALGENSVLRMDYITIGQAIISGFDIYNPVSTANRYIDLQSANINISSLIIKDGRLTNLGDGLKLIRSAGATVGKVTIDNIIGNSGCTYINTDGVEFATALELTLINCSNAPSNAITIGGAQVANIYANNLSCSSTLYNMYGSGAVAIKSDYVKTSIPSFVNAQSAVTLINPQRSRDVQRSVPTTGQTVTIAAGKTLGYCNTAHLISPAGTLAELTLALPSDPIDGEVIKLIITQAITSLIITGGTLMGLTSGSSSSAGYVREFTYSSVEAKWL